MKIMFSILTVLALSSVVLHAQTNTFIVPLGTNVVLTPAVQAVTATSVTVDRQFTDNVAQRAVIWLHGVPQPIVVTGANFVSMKAAVGPTFGTWLVGYLTSQSH